MLVLLLNAWISGGSFLEMYDFMVFGYYATAIGNAFFRQKSKRASRIRWSLETNSSFKASYLRRKVARPQREQIEARQ